MSQSASSKPRRLEIGPGDHPLPGFETLDWVGAPMYQSRWGYERLADSVGQDVFDEVYASHVLEHILWNRTQRALQDVHEILKPGGVFEVWVPDFEYVVDCYHRQTCGDAWRRDNPKNDPMRWINGRIFTYGPGPENLHHACFDFRYLSQCLHEAGLIEITRISHRTRGVSHGPIDLGVRCVRPSIEAGE